MIQNEESEVILVLGDDVSTDTIYPGRFMATVLPGETPQYAFADIPAFQNLAKSGSIKPGNIIVAGRNFGCGSSREQAASCLRGYELTIVVRGVARIFLQNAINLGLSIVICPEIEASQGDRLSLTGNLIVNHTTQKSYALQPLPKARQEIMEAGGLIAYTRKRLLRGNTKRI